MALAAHVDRAASYLSMVIGIAGIAFSVLLFFGSEAHWCGGWDPPRLAPSTRFSAF